MHHVGAWQRRQLPTHLVKLAGAAQVRLEAGHRRQLGVVRRQLGVGAAKLGAQGAGVQVGEVVKQDVGCREAGAGPGRGATCQPSWGTAGHVEESDGRIARRACAARQGPL